MITPFPSSNLRIQLLAKRHCVELAELNGLCESFCFHGNHGTDLFRNIDVPFNPSTPSDLWCFRAWLAGGKVNMVCIGCGLTTGWLMNYNADVADLCASWQHPRCFLEVGSCGQFLPTEPPRKVAHRRDMACFWQCCLASCDLLPAGHESL